jgi:ATP-dependent Clp protease ATP-binding subunit ClpX
VAGPGVYICDGCIGLCIDVLSGDPTARITTLPSPSDPDPLTTQLRTEGERARFLDEQLRETVAAARTKEMSWAHIGNALGMTRQSAWERFSGEE